MTVGEHPQRADSIILPGKCYWSCHLLNKLTVRINTMVHYIQTETLKTDVMAYALKLAKIMTLYWTYWSRTERKYPFHIITSFFVLFPKTYLTTYLPQVVVSWENWWVDDQYTAGYRNWFVPSAGCAVQQPPSKRHSSFLWKEKREEK